MENWSDEPADQFRIKFFLDTNVLTYLIDNTYSGLSATIDFLKLCTFTNLVSSHYVIFELVGVRKREHYLREVLTKSTNAGGDVNMSSLLKYKDDFAAPEAKFIEVKASIKTKVENELQRIVNDFGIVYEDNLLHNKLLQPTFDINLNTRVSKEDSLVLTSSLWPDELTKESFVCLVSNDEQFIKGCNEFDLEPIITPHTLKKPILEYIKSMNLDGSYHLNLTDNNDDAKLPLYLPKKIKELLIRKNQSLFLGKTIPCGNGAGFPTDVLCFRLNANTPLNQGLFLTIIGANLDFIYTTRLKIDEFWDQTRIQVYPFTHAEERNVSFKPLELNGDNQPAALPANIIAKLRETGNLVFINPDSFV